MSGISIIVEGEEDIRFLEDFIFYHFKKKIPRDLFIEVEGKTERLHLSSRKIQSSKKNIIIFDADDPDFDSTITKLKTKCKELEFNIDDIFLLPDNKQRGNLEALLKGCIPPPNRPLLKCIQDYDNCKMKLNLKDNRPINPKGELFIYHGSFENSGNAIGTKRNYLIRDIWNLDCEEGKPLKDFLDPFIAS